MEAEVTPESALAEARNVIRNRVEPALGELEDVLKQSGLTFFWKSVLGATALTFSATATPGSTIQGGARLIAQTMEYRFSKTAMVRKHPFGYLHQVGEEFGHSPRHSVTRVAETLQDPRGTLRDLLQGLLLARLERRGEQREGAKGFSSLVSSDAANSERGARTNDPCRATPDGGSRTVATAPLAAYP